MACVDSETQKARSRAYYLKNREKIIARVREYQTANPEKRRQHYLNYYRNNKHKWQEYAAKNADRLASYKAEWYAKNSARISAEFKAWYRSLPDDERAKYVAKAKAWTKANPVKSRAHRKAITARRRAKIKGATLEETKALREFFHWVATAETIHCAYCGRAIPKNRREVDHVVPLSKGGKHHRSNLVCACRRCNRRKSAMDVGEFTGQPLLF